MSAAGTAKHHKARKAHLPETEHISWMVPGLFLGMAAGVVSEAFLGLSLFLMVGGSIAGLGLGALADAIRKRLKKADHGDHAVRHS